MKNKLSIIIFAVFLLVRFNSMSPNEPIVYDHLETFQECATKAAINITHEGPQLGITWACVFVDVIEIVPIPRKKSLGKNI